MKKNYLALIGIILLIIICIVSFNLGRKYAAKEEDEENTKITLKDNLNVYAYIDEVDEEIYEDGTLILGVAKSLKELKTIEEENDIYDNEKINEQLNFKKYQYIIVVALDNCGEYFEYQKTKIIDKKTTIYFDAIYGCGVCGNSYIINYIEVPKDVKLTSNIKTEIKETEYPICDGDIAYKPVLYLYPETKTDIKVNFAKEENLTTTYPKFKEEWQVTVSPNGDLYDNEGNYYYALYWEEKENKNIDFAEGFYVSKDNAIKFLEEKLFILGLNAKERNEFIMYWLPILEKNEHNLVYFELTDELQKENELIIEPKPDTLIRVRMHVKKVDKKTTIKEQQLTKISRNGYTAIEWGGVIH